LVPCINVDFTRDKKGNRLSKKNTKRLTDPGESAFPRYREEAGGTNPTKGRSLGTKTNEGKQKKGKFKGALLSGGNHKSEKNGERPSGTLLGLGGGREKGAGQTDQSNRGP